MVLLRPLLLTNLLHALIYLRQDTTEQLRVEVLAQLPTNGRLNVCHDLTISSHLHHNDRKKVHLDRSIQDSVHCLDLIHDFEIWT